MDRKAYHCPRFFFALIEKIIIVGRGQVIVSLLDGMEIECEYFAEKKHLNRCT
jgi:hypothetical protein